MIYQQMMFLSPSIPVSLPLSLSTGILVQQFFSLVFGQVDRMHLHLCRFSGIYIECWTLKMVGKHISWLGLQLCCDFVIVLPVLTWQNMKHAGKRHLAGQDAFCAIIIFTCKYFLSSKNCQKCGEKVAEIYCATTQTSSFTLPSLTAFQNVDCRHRNC